MLQTLVRELVNEAAGTFAAVASIFVLVGLMLGWSWLREYFGGPRR